MRASASAEVCNRLLTLSDASEPVKGIFSLTVGSMAAPSDTATSAKNTRVLIGQDDPGIAAQLGYI
jgi:hypothetical protein